MYACYIVYNNERTIIVSLKSIVPYVEKIIMVDGAFKDYPHIIPYSTDYTKELAQKICGTKLTWIGCNGKAWIGEPTKRNVYLKHIPNGKWFITIDGDEIVRGKIREAFERIEKTNYTCVGVSLWNFSPKWEGSGLTIPREAWNNLEWIKNHGIKACIYRKQEEMMYREHHSRIYIGDKIVSYIEATLNNVDIMNMKHLRTYDRYIADVKYRYARPRMEL